MSNKVALPFFSRWECLVLNLPTKVNERTKYFVNQVIGAAILLEYNFIFLKDNPV
jgi:hypothetical protein